MHSQVYNPLSKLSNIDWIQGKSKKGNGFGKRIENLVCRKIAYPTNILHMATEFGYIKHPATFPVAMLAWFIKLFTYPGDTVLDPFSGSGTALLDALYLGQNRIGFDMMKA